MQMSISSTLRVFGLFLYAGLAVVVTVSMVALRQLEVTGPVYTKIAFGQGLSVASAAARASARPAA